MLCMSKSMDGNWWGNRHRGNLWYWLRSAIASLWHTHKHTHMCTLILSISLGCYPMRCEQHVWHTDWTIGYKKVIETRDAKQKWSAQAMDAGQKRQSRRGTAITRKYLYEIYGGSGDMARLKFIGEFFELSINKLAAMVVQNSRMSWRQFEVYWTAISWVGINDSFRYTSIRADGRFSANIFFDFMEIHDYSWNFDF